MDNYTNNDIKRWNFDADDEGLSVCKGLHNNGESCESNMERLSPHEVLDIINRLRAELLQIEYKIDSLQKN